MKTHELKEAKILKDKWEWAWKCPVCKTKNVHCSSYLINHCLKCQEVVHLFRAEERKK